MGTRYKFYVLQEFEVINSYENIKILDEILDLDKKFLSSI